MSLPEYVTINGTSYASAKLSDAARNQVMNVRAAEGELVRLQLQLAITQTARNSYLNALIAEVKGGSSDAADKAAAPKKARAPAKAAAKPAAKPAKPAKAAKAAAKAE